MNLPGNGLGRFGRVGLALAGLVALWLAIVHLGGLADIDTPKERVQAFVLICLVLVLIRYLPAMRRWAR